MCKPIAATMYGVGNRLDSSPELLFVLRCVDHTELIEQAIPAAPLEGKSTAPAIATDDLGAIFGIEIGDASQAVPATRNKPAAKKAVKKTITAKKSAAPKKKPIPKKG